MLFLTSLMASLGLFRTLVRANSDVRRSIHAVIIAPAPHLNKPLKSALTKTSSCRGFSQG